jgi:hypothetical protein
MQGHVSVLQPSAPFEVVAGRAGRDHIRPGVHPAQVTRQDVVDGQVVYFPSTVLAGIIVAAENLAPGQFDSRARAMNHILEADDGWTWERCRDSFNLAAPVGNQRGFSGEHQPDSPPHVANINWLEVGVQNQDIHNISKTWQIILQCD